MIPPDDLYLGPLAHIDQATALRELEEAILERNRERKRLKREKRAAEKALAKQRREAETEERKKERSAARLVRGGSAAIVNRSMQMPMPEELKESDGKGGEGKGRGARDDTPELTLGELLAMMEAAKMGRTGEYRIVAPVGTEGNLVWKT